MKKVDQKNGSKNIKLLGSASLFNDVGSEMITPIIPIYLTEIGGGGIAVGAFSGLRDGLTSLFKLFGGWLSDNLGKRKKFLFIGYIVSLISRFFLVLANSWGSILVFISFERLGKLRDAPRDAIIAQSTKKRGKGFGVQQMMDNIGGIIGTIFVIFLLWKFQLNFKIIILIAGSLSSLSLIPLFFVKEPKTKPMKRNLFKGIKNLNKKLKYFIFVSSIFTLANFGLYTFLILKVKEETGSIIAALFLYVLFNIIYAIFVIPFGELSDKIGRKKVLLLGYFLLAVIGVIVILYSNIIYLIFVFILYGIVYAITHTNQRAFASDLSGNMKGTGLGLFYSVIGMVNIPAGLIAGLIWNFNSNLMFVYVSIISLISVLLLFMLKEGDEYKKFV